MDFGGVGGPNLKHPASVSTQVKFSEFTLGSQPVVLGPIQASVARPKSAVAFWSST